MNSAARPLAIISGASRGLGFETARGLAAQGFDLALIAKDADRLTGARQSLLNEFSPSNPQLSITTHGADLEVQGQARKIAEAINASLPVAQVLVLAHGVMSEKMSKTLRMTALPALIRTAARSSQETQRPMAPLIASITRETANRIVIVFILPLSFCA